MALRNAFDPARPGPTLVASALAAAFIGLAACTGGGESGPVGGPAHPALQAKTSYSDADLRHFLVRTHFGVNNDDLAILRASGIRAYVDRMLDFPAANTRSFEQQAETILYNPNDPPGLKGGFPLKDQLIRWWLTLIEQNPEPFQEVMAMFWHGHFSVSSLGLNPTNRYMMREHVDYLRTYGAGNMRQMLIDVSRQGAMMNWLDTIDNSRQAPNENYAREFWELFTLGVDNGYTQNDITESARALTGYGGLVGPKGQSIVQFFPSRHDSGSKTFLGGLIHGSSTEDEFEEVVDITLQNAPVAEFLCNELFEHFCYEDPETAIIDELAQILRDNGWELKPVLAVLLQSQAFYSPQARQGHISSPIEHAVGFIRSTGMRMPISLLASLLRYMGQVPTQPPTVEGWPGGTFWLASQDIVERANFVAHAISARSYQAQNGFSWSDVLPPSGQRSAEQVVDAMADLLFVQLNSQERADYIEYLETEMLEGGAVQSSPFVASSSQLEERVRGLLYILAQHPTYMTR